ncbi:beta-1,6-N-acetylglucosaminyltransferase [Arsenicicoccus sp. UBA7492]|uniref:beta-1,6-N-acetylglucosaminyltransferase n=1 Tax=Arsenicicoccus sp. UBA7492 TaxID=1946057 RepID=UPI00257D696E|nr:beta-1,6-N-acetylglucosaminyltransferase [Arsenicicoccus sp. UBA7492]
MCHTDREGLARALRRIRELSPQAQIVVRPDGPGLVTSQLLAEVGATAVDSDVRITWGGWSMMQAELEVLEHVHGTVDVDHVVLVSGQDYPIRDLAQWEAQVRATGADALVDVYPPMEEDWQYRWWSVQPPRLGPRIARRTVKWGWRRVAPAVHGAVLFYQGRRDSRWALGVRRAELVRGRPPVTVIKGSQWLTMSSRALDSVLRRHREDPAVRAFFERTRISDESYVQSLLLADASLRVMDCPTTFARFRYDEWSPTWLDLDELALAARTPAAFARKLPADVDDAVVAEADRLCARRGDEVPAIEEAVPGEVKLTGAERAPGLPPVATGLAAARG